MDDFSRKVYCLLGVPVDNIAMTDVVARMAAGARSRQPFFLSTPNLNFVTTSQRDEKFRQSLIASDLCPIDGMGALVICRILGLPITNRVAGSDIPAALARYLAQSNAEPFKIAFFGGETGVADKACDVLNSNSQSKLRGVCAIDPGMLTPDKMQNPDHIAKLNASAADFILVALGAPKGQAWIMQNRMQLTAPSISHLGATINFIAGTVKRAPALFQKTGMEWLWRIKEEPRLASRYYQDFKTILAMMTTRVLPLAVWLRRGRRTFADATLQVTETATTLSLQGAARDDNLEPLVISVRELSSAGKPVSLDLSRLDFFDLHFAGIVMMLEKHLSACGQALHISNINPTITRAFRLCGLGHLL